MRSRQGKPVNKKLVVAAVVAVAAAFLLLAGGTFVLLAVSGGGDAKQQAADGGSATAPGTAHGDYALRFNGKSSYLVASSLPYEKLGDVTIEAYLKPLARRDAFPIAWLGENSLGVRLTPEDWGLCAIDGGNMNYTSTRRRPLSGARSHIAVVAGGNRVRLFVDGTASNQDFESLPAVGGGRGLYIGGVPLAEAWQTDGFFEGIIDDVRISRGARYGASFTPPADLDSDADTIALYHFDEGSGDVARDASGNGHDLKIVGAKWVAQSQPPPLVARRGAQRQRARSRPRLRRANGRRSRPRHPLG